MEREMPSNPRAGSLIIVAQEQRDVWRSLVQEFQDVERFQILLDRRSGERRAPWGPVADDRRAGERRSRPRIDDDLRARPCVLVYPHDQRPHD